MASSMATERNMTTFNAETWYVYLIIIAILGANSCENMQNS